MAEGQLPARLVVSSYAIVLQQDPHILERVRIPLFTPSDPTHRPLAELSQRAHAVAAGRDLTVQLAELEHEVDACAALLWGLSDTEIQAVRAALDE
jgi:hypothetical protein